MAVLVAIAIPIFTSQLEKSRESVDLANLRSAYAECSAEAITVDTATYTSVYKKVDPKQTTSGWDISPKEVAGKNAIDMVTGTPVYVVVNTDGTYSMTTTKPTATTAKELT